LKQERPAGAAPVFLCGGFRVMRISRHLGKILSGLGLGLAITVVVWWWRSTSGPDYLLRCGQKALNQGNAEQAERQALRLEAAGHADHAHLLRGEIAVKDGDFVKALAELNQIRDQGELRVEAAALSGHCHLQLGVPLQAERALLFVLE